MKKKHIGVICLSLVLMLIGGGCGQKAEETTVPETTAPPTAQEVVEKMQEALLKTPCGQAELVLNMTLDMDAGEYGTMEMSTVNSTKITISQDPVSSYTVATVDVDYGGEKSQTVTENYTVVEEEEVVSYVNSSGIWMKVPTGQTAEELAKSASSVAVDSGNVTIDESVTVWEEKPAICLVTELTGDALQGALGTMLENIGQNGGSLEEAAELAGTMDYSALTCDTRIYLDAETYLPRAEEMTFHGMSEMMAPLYEQMGITVDVTECTAIGNFTSYEPQEAVVLPEGAAEQAEVWTRLLSGEPDNGDGTFSIREGAVLADIIHPEGFELEEKSYDSLTFKRDDYRKITYTIYYLTNPAENPFVDYVDQKASFYEKHGADLKREEMTLTTDALTFQCDILGLEWTTREDCMFYGWTTLAANESEGYYLLMELSDGYNDGMGNSKSADVTAEELMSYLNGVSLGKYMQK